MELRGSETERKLWEAFAGESKAFCRYLYYAKRAQREGYEQLAAILFRYAKQKGYDVGKSVELNGFEDANTVSTYATDAMRWAVANGLIQGSNSKLNPKGTATRAQVATILMRFMELYAK